MGTVPNNFPPTRGLDLKKHIVGSLLNQTGSYGPTVFFTAPVTGMYQIGALFQIVQSDGAGTLMNTFTPPHAAPIVGSPIAPAVNGDRVFQPRSYWMNAGDTVSITCTAAGFVSTTFNSYLYALRVF